MQFPPIAIPLAAPIRLDSFVISTNQCMAWIADANGTTFGPIMGLDPAKLAGFAQALVDGYNYAYALKAVPVSDLRIVEVANA